MSQKRREKLEKRKKKAKAAGAKKITVNTSALPSKVPDEFKHAYCANDPNIEKDMDLLQMALETHYGHLQDDFHPPIYETTDDGMKPADWVATYRDLMMEKYQSMEVVEPKIKLNLFILSTIKLENTI